MRDDILFGARTGLRVSELAIGTGRLGRADDGRPRPAEAHAILDAFADAGGTLIDTSNVYQEGLAEEVIGALLADRGRDRFVVASKYTRPPPRSAPAEVGNHRRAMITEVERSLRRLRTDRIDVYMPHFDDGATPIEEIMYGLDSLVRAGKIVYVALSNFPAWRIAAASAMADERGLARVVALQLQYSLTERSIEREHLPLARAAGLAVMGWSPLGGGQITRAGSDGPLRSVLDAIAAERSASAAAIAIAWVLARGVIPVIGPRTREQLDGNLAATAIELSADQLRRLDDASAVTLGYPYDLLREQQRERGPAPVRPVW